MGEIDGGRTTPADGALAYASLAASGVAAMPPQVPATPETPARDNISVKPRRDAPSVPQRAKLRMPRQDIGPVGLLGMCSAIGRPLGLSDRFPMAPHSAARNVILRRGLFCALLAVTTVAGSLRLWTALRVDGVTPTEFALLGIFAVLFAWISTSFWLTCFGTYAMWRERASGASKMPDARNPEPMKGPARTAIAMPVYNESAEEVFARLEAICDSLRNAGAARAFDVFVLSDSNKPDRIAAEQREWMHLRRRMGGYPNVYYRRRTENKGRKSGNIEDFCTNWGGRYEYMVVLDADSLMTGDTLRTMVTYMDANPDTGLLQVPPKLVGCESLFARIQQFASSVYGPMFSYGLHYLQGDDGNFWGHNAIIRVRAFTENCGLPILPGKAPLGGEILSHDFVEAALMRRAGWKVQMAPELEGSFEETPPTLGDHLARDRRWCEGNLQHARLLPGRGFKFASRLHMLLGVMSYVASPLWLTMILLSVAVAYQIGAQSAVTYMGAYPILSFHLSQAHIFLLLLGGMVVLLFGPKLVAFVSVCSDPKRRAEHGGAIRLGVSVLLECVLSTLLAPVAMLAHSWFVVNNLLGRTVGWSGQNRGDKEITLIDTFWAFLPHTLIACVAGLGIFMLMPKAGMWLIPVLLGGVLAVPLAFTTGRCNIGRWARAMGLFLIPSETRGEPVLDHAAHLADAARRRNAGN